MYHIKKVYRLIFEKYLKWADVTIFGYLNRIFEQKFSSQENKFENLELKNIQKVISINSSINSKNEKVILMDSMHYYAGITFQNCLMSMLLSVNNKTKVIGFSPLPEKKIFNLYQQFGVNKFVVIYKFINLKVFFLSIYITMKTFIKNQKLTKFNYIKVIIDDIDIGEHIYDQFLRREFHATYRKKSLKYYLYIYRGCYYYFRFKEILIKEKVTDIILSHIVYMPATLIKAASVVNPDITIWATNDYYADLGVSKSKSYQNKLEVVDRRQFRNIYSSFILDNYTKDDIETIFKFINNKKVSWVAKNRKNDICLNLDNYKYDKNKKNIFILPHAFNDGVRHANNPIFCDYYVWFVETLKILSKNDNINIFIKPHPLEYKFNYKESSKSVVSEILKDSTNKNIFYIEENLSIDFLYSITNCIVTANGSSGLEAPCRGIPVITAARGTYYDADTTINSETYKEYENNLNIIHLIPKLTSEIIFKAKIVFIFAILLRNVETNLNIPKLEKGMKYGVDNDIQAYKTIDEWFCNMKDMKDTELYKNYKFMLENDFDEFINIDAFERVLKEAKENNE